VLFIDTILWYQLILRRRNWRRRNVLNEMYLFFQLPVDVHVGEEHD